MPRSRAGRAAATVLVTLVGSAEAAGGGPVPIWMVPVLMVFWMFVFGLIALAFFHFRGKYTAEYEALQSEGKIMEDEPDDAQAFDETHVHVEEQIAPAEGILSFLSFPDDEISSEMGLDASLYLAHMQQCAKFWAAHFCTMGILLMILYCAGGEVSNIDLYSFCYGNLKKKSGLAIIPVFAAFWLVVSNVMFAAWRQKLMDAIKLEAADQIHASEHTIIIKNVNHESPLNTPFVDWFEEAYPGQVANVHVALNLRDLSRNIRHQTRLIHKMNAMTEGNAAMDVNKFKTMQALLKSHEKEETNLRAREIESSRIIFVTFTTKVGASKFLLDHKSKSLPPCDLGLQEHKAQMAPLPGDMYWENIAITKQERYARMAGTYTITIILFSIFMAVACAFVFFLGFDYMKILYGVEGYPEYTKATNAVKDFLGPFMFYGVCTVLIAIAFLILEEEIPPVVKYFTKYEGYMTKSKKQQQYMFKCYLHYVVYHLVMSTGFLFLLAQLVKHGSRVRLYLECIGAFHANRMMLTVFVVDAAHWIEGVHYFRRTVSVIDEDHAQHEFHSAEEADAEEEGIDSHADKFFNNKFDYSRNYAETTAVFSSASYYAIMHPMIMFFAAIYFWAKWAIDKYQIVNQYSKPHFAYGRRARSTTTYLLCSVVVGRVGDVLYYLFIEPDTLIGVAYLVVFMLAAAALFFYVYRNKIFKKDTMKGLSGSDGDADRKSKALEKQQSVDGGDAGEDFVELYAPPTMDNLKVSVELLDNDDITIDNPVNEKGAAHNEIGMTVV